MHSYIHFFKKNKIKIHIKTKKNQILCIHKCILHKEQNKKFCIVMHPTYILQQGRVNRRYY